MKLWLAALVACAAFAPAVCPARTIDLADLRREVSVAQPRLSPDGRSIAFLKSVQNFDKDRSDVRLMLLDVASGSIRPLTYDREGIDSPRWSPSGDRIAFMANVGSGDEQRAQIFVMPMNGGDAQQVTKAQNDVQEFAWRPDGKAFAYVVQDVAPNKADLDKHVDAFDVGDADYKMTAAALPSHLWTASADGSHARRLTSGAWSLSTVNAGAIAPVSWSHDGKTIAVWKLPNAVFGDSDAADVALVDAKTGRVTDIPGQRKYSTAPVFSPTDAMLAVEWFRHGTFNSIGSLVLMPPSGGEGFEPAHSLDSNVAGFWWTPDGRGIVFSAELGPRVGLWLVPASGGPRRLDVGDVTLGGDLDVGKNDAIAFVGDSPTRPGELYYKSSPDAPVRRLTNYNASIAALDLGGARELTWRSADGFTEDGIVYYPPHFSPHNKYPLVLVVHGGPQSASSLSFGDLEQLLTARGFVVLRPNYRGSTNLGDAYQHAIYRDTGVGPGKDVMAGVAALEKSGYIDTTRMAVSGWSYGGYMTTWLESHYDVWKAAMAGASLTDWVADYTISFYQKGDMDFFNSSPWTTAGWKMWRDQSPIAYAANVKAPTLIMGDVGDPNVPIYNSYLWYHALKDNGVDVQFIAFPRNSHYPGDPVGAESVARHWVDWMVKYLK